MHALGTYNGIRWSWKVFLGTNTTSFSLHSLCSSDVQLFNFGYGGKLTLQRVMIVILKVILLVRCVYPVKIKWSNFIGLFYNWSHSLWVCFLWGGSSFLNYLSFISALVIRNKDKKRKQHIFLWEWTFHWYADFLSKLFIFWIGGSDY